MPSPPPVARPGSSEVVDVDAADLDPTALGAEGLLVVGTDTGVGKTVVTAGLTGWLRAEGVEARAIKPAQTGAPEDDDDAGLVADACGDPDAATCLRRLGPALAPRVAADLADVALDYGSLLADCRGEVAASEVAVVEGIGGLRVPLADDAEVLDLAADLGLPAVVVARSGLGTLNHTALTVGALRAREVPVRLVVLNEYAGDTIAERTNPEELRRMLGVPVATIPAFDASDARSIVPAVRSALSRERLADVLS